LKIHWRFWKKYLFYYVHCAILGLSVSIFRDLEWCNRVLSQILFHLQPCFKTPGGTSAYLYQVKKCYFMFVYHYRAFLSTNTEQLWSVVYKLHSLTKRALCPTFIACGKPYVRGSFCVEQKYWFSMVKMFVKVYCVCTKLIHFRCQMHTRTMHQIVLFTTNIFYLFILISK